MSNPASSNATSTSSTTVSSFSNKSCYRLYAGHGNWINLNAKTTQDLLNIFAKGEPCRYQLAAGLFIDIIPNDVDCNSRNIAMVGLMRADLVYEPQMMENHVQQLMSHYVRSLLDDQGIIDAFPPLRQGEDLPIITSLPTHRHLSLVPSVVGAVRRGPKSTTSSNAAQQRKMVSTSSSSSVTMPDDDHLGLSSSSSSSATHDSLTMSNTGGANNRKRALNASSGGAGTVTTRRSHLKRGRQNSDHVDSIELMSQHHPPKRHMMSLELPNLNAGASAAAAAAAVAAVSATHSVYNTNNAASLGMSSFMDHTANHGHGGLIGFHHHHQQQQQHGNGFWLPSSYQNSPIQTTSRPSSGGGFNFEFGMDFDHTLQQPQTQQQQPHQQQHKQSPTDILHDYDISHQMMPNEHDLYSNNSATAANAVTHMHQHHHHVDHSHLLNDTRQQQQHHMMTTASSSDTTSLESFVPASPIPTNWLETANQHHQHLQPRESGHWQQHYASSTAVATSDLKTAALTTAVAPLDASDLKKLKLEYTNTAKDTQQTTMNNAAIATTTGASLPVVDFESDIDNNINSNRNNDDNALSSSPSTSSSSSSPTTTSQ
ncbi:hypothetical protein MBANPS3_007073 [Mucor bainieri]